MATAPKTDPKNPDASGKDTPPEILRQAGAPRRVKALEMGYYDGVIREEGAVFDNTLGLLPKGEGPGFDPNAWFVAADKKAVVDDADDMA